MKKRVHERYTPKGTVRVINILTNDSIGAIANISLGGFLLIAEDVTIPEGAVYQLRIVSGDEGTPDYEINVGATCLWQTDASTAGSIWAGFQIIDISDGDEIKLQDYIASLS